MRLVQVVVPAGKRETILAELEERGIDYVVTDETGSQGYTGVVYFPLPTKAVEDVLSALRDAGLERDAYTVVVDAETVVSKKFEELQERYEEEESEDRIAREEITAKATDLAPKLGPFLVMTVVSAVVAAAGLLLDSPAVVVGSMVIAPLIGPAMATSVGTVVDDREMFLRGVKLQAVGFVAAVAAAAGFAFLARTVHLVPPLSPQELLSIGQIRERLTPDFLSLAVALAAGVAGAFSLSSGVSTALVGVMIAAALVPPTAVIGIGLAWGLPTTVVGSTVLVLVNFLSINLAALAVLWYQGYRPEHWFRLSEARSATLKRIAALAVAIAVLSLFLGGVTYSSYQHGQFEETTRMEVQDTFESGEYAALSLVDVQVTYARTPSPITVPDRVVLTVGRPDGSTYPTLAATLREEIHDATGYDVAVQVRFVEIQSASGAAGGVDATTAPEPGPNAALVRPTRGPNAAG
ncbi:putative hydrophobic protein (TIGR00341 family) [Halarchaeum rubridurum]|uniref:Putative hydrophobic protein (TIGR00341 family) n=1 Tax=Halarchaeum rubridurum TaxID=489911 RepID=A0A830G1C9_9EURY|nr:TIGR00341 family protein [Halarchaeum rubridurum]MBP1954944.1 putative hydrophobic protein (TIGR00341 family) [Halarchaeum rubridurum]GGM70195.1 TIGR00341 family protein [Halarchaeum rubridurum]